MPAGKEFDSLTEKKKKNYVKLLKKTCRTRWLSLHADATLLSENTRASFTL